MQDPGRLPQSTRLSTIGLALWGIERSLAHVEQLELVSVRVGDDGAESDFDRKRMDHDSTARGDKPLDCSPDVLYKQIDSRVRALGLQDELSVGVGETQSHLIRTPRQITSCPKRS
jgi:hypothetical protein